MIHISPISTRSRPLQSEQFHGGLHQFSQHPSIQAPHVRGCLQGFGLLLAVPGHTKHCRTGQVPLKASPQHRHEANGAHTSADISSSSIEVPLLEHSSAPFTLHPVPFPKHQGFFCFVFLMRNLCISIKNKAWVQI